MDISYKEKAARPIPSQHGAPARDDDLGETSSWYAMEFCAIAAELRARTAMLRAHMAACNEMQAIRTMLLLQDDILEADLLIDSLRHFQWAVAARGVLAWDELSARSATEWAKMQAEHVVNEATKWLAATMETAAPDVANDDSATCDSGVVRDDHHFGADGHETCEKGDLEAVESENPTVHWTSDDWANFLAEELELGEISTTTSDFAIEFGAALSRCDGGPMMTMYDVRLCDGDDDVLKQRVLSKEEMALYMDPDGIPMLHDLDPTLVFLSRVDAMRVSRPVPERDKLLCEDALPVSGDLDQKRVQDVPLPRTSTACSYDAQLWTPVTMSMAIATV
mmetsp:Transcript_7968/g.27055  ORF Transcript_7968/g.27055 Transcript_7968/m.27055 type:complete len:337 (+) Transcript_7968:222-1232(+)